MLAREVNHRIKNTLLLVASAIHLTQGELGDRADLSDLHSQVEAIRLLHDELSSTDPAEEVNLAAYLDGLLRTLTERLVRRPVRPQTELDEVAVNPRRAATIGLLVNELATNAIKHGDATNPAVSVALSVAPARITLEIGNSGPSLPPHAGLEQPQTLGMRLIAALSSQRDAAVNVERGPNPKWRFVIPHAGERDHFARPSGTGDSPDGASGSGTV